jgi:hypothetical protein
MDRSDESIDREMDRPTNGKRKGVSSRQVDSVDGQQHDTEVVEVAVDRQADERTDEWNRS